MSVAVGVTEAARKPIGDPLDRVDGRVKVTGRARYAAEFPVDRLAYGYAVQSTIASGRISGIDTGDAERSPGVITILTHVNAPLLAAAPPSGANEQKQKGKSRGGSGSAGGGDPFAKPYVLQSDEVLFFGQYIAVVVAETFEQARDAARLVRVRYARKDPLVSLERNLDRAYTPEKMLIPDIKPVTKLGDFDRGWSDGTVQVDATYVTPNEHNNPMEPHATIAAWDGSRLTLYDSTQMVNGVQQNIAMLFGLEPASVHVVAPYIGGGFGSKGPTWEHVTLTVMAAKVARRPVKLALARQQMFAGTGYRPHTIQHVRLAATPDGKLTALAHEITTPTNIRRSYIEHAGEATPRLYAAPNLIVAHRAVALNVPRGSIMRAPGVATGVPAIECAMDELAVALGLDPIELRRRNEPDRDPEKNIPWSSRSLLACLDQGATRFGWERRKPEPRSMRDGRLLVGMGVSASTYPANRRPCSARVRLLPDGGALVQLAATDIGTGTYTVLTQIAADALGFAPDRVKVEIGDSHFPPTPGSGGSWGASSYGVAVHDACLAVRAKLDALVSPETGPHGDYAAILRRYNLREGLEAGVDAKVDEAEKKKHSMHAFGAQFAEVRVDPDTCEVRVSRHVGAFACGRILNAKTARSQFAGGIVMGIGMALTEESIVDDRYGHFVNADLAEYHVPVNRDVPAIDIVLVEERDPIVNSLGTKGLGEIGIVGVASAIANAVFHATGKRVRDFPITPDKLL